jgi:hypothetical protein
LRLRNFDGNESFRNYIGQASVCSAPINKNKLLQDKTFICIKKFQVKDSE